MQSQLYPCMCLHPLVLAGPGPIQQNCSHFPGAGTSWEAGQGKPLALSLPPGHVTALPAQGCPQADCAPRGLALVKPTEEHPPALLLVGRFQEQGESGQRQLQSPCFGVTDCKTHPLTS